MSELTPTPQSRSELRASSSAPTTASIARHGQLGKRRAWPFVVGIIGGTLAVLLVTSAAIAGVVYNRLFANVQDTAVDISPTDAAPLPAIGAIEGGFNILIVGSDTRLGQNGIGGSYEDESANLNDVNMLLHVSQDQTNAVAISFPRDMVVGIPECPMDDGSGSIKDYSYQPINEALSQGGLNCVAMTVHALTGLDIQFAGVIDFTGVIAMGDAIGGVPVCVDGPIHDDNTGLMIDQAGTYTMLGVDALAFLRTREHVGDGSDLTRISSQQVYLSSLVRTLKSAETLSDPTKVYNLAKAALDHMQLSTSLASLDTMVAIALALKDIPLQNVTFVQYPTVGSNDYPGKVEPNSALADQLMGLVSSDQPFLLEAAGDGRGSTIDPNAPAPTLDPTIDTTDLPVIPIPGQTALDQTCSVSNDY